MLKQLSGYLLAVLANGFGIAGAIYGLIELVAWLVGKEIPIVTRKWRLAIGVMLVICAQFVVWQEEHARWSQENAAKIELQGETKQLRGELASKNENLSSLRDQLAQLASRPPQIQIPPSQIQIVRVPDTGKALVLTPAQTDALTTALRRFTGQSVSLFLHNTTPETNTFANALKTAMEKAGLTVTVDPGMVIGVVPHGVSMEFGEERTEIANVVAAMLINFGVAEKPISARKSTDRGIFRITIAP